MIWYFIFFQGYFENFFCYYNFHILYIFFVKNFNIFFEITHVTKSDDKELAKKLNIQY